MIISNYTILIFDYNRILHWLRQTSYSYELDFIKLKRDHLDNQTKQITVLDKYSALQVFSI